VTGLGSENIFPMMSDRCQIDPDLLEGRILKRQGDRRSVARAGFFLLQTEESDPLLYSSIENLRDDNG
jgi:hypothetical protein